MRTHCKKCAALLDSGNKTYCRECNRRMMWEYYQVPENRAKVRAKSKEWRDANPEKVKAAARRARIRKDYGISLDEFDALARLQGGRCAACGDDPAPVNGQKLHVDHDHITGEVRALLCNNCNWALGLLKEDLTRILRLSWYVLEHSKEPPEESTPERNSYRSITEGIR